MIVLAAMLAASPAFPWLDRSWLNDRARLEKTVATGQMPTSSRGASAQNPSRPTSRTVRPGAEAEINGM